MVCGTFVNRKLVLNLVTNPQNNLLLKIILAVKAVLSNGCRKHSCFFALSF